MVADPNNNVNKTTTKTLQPFTVPLSQTLPPWLNTGPQPHPYQTSMIPYPPMAIGGSLPQILYPSTYLPFNRGRHDTFMSSQVLCNFLLAILLFINEIYLLLFITYLSSISILLFSVLLFIISIRVICNKYKI